ncbi:glycosyltransferase [Enterococcus hailinensis]|uniref:glycosyltransferase n=1 Tax=Enterococcus hailinensis TaxID=3238988 RepID=UPI0038B25BD3
MKIGILSPAFGLGGASKVATYVGNSLQDKETEVFFVSYLNSVEPEGLVKHYNIYKKKIFLVEYFNKLRKYLAYKRKGYFLPENYVKSEIKHLKIVFKKENPDVIIFNTFIPAILFSSFIKKEFPNVKLVTWMHSDPEYSLNHIAKFYQKIYKESFKKVDKVICLSKDVGSILKSYGANVRVIYNPLILRTNEISKLTNNVISFTARLDIYIKGIDYLCKLANYLPEKWYIRVAGDGTREEKEKFSSLILDNKVEDKIKFVGPLKGEKLIDHYLSSSIFVSTSRTEGLPLVMIEALSVGLPIVSFDHKGAKEILLDGKVGIVIANENIFEMSKKIKFIASNHSIMKEYQSRSLKRAKDFKANKIIQEWKTLLNDLVSEEN